MLVIFFLHKKASIRFFSELKITNNLCQKEESSQTARLSAMAFHCPPEALPPPLAMGQLVPGCVGCCCMLRERESVQKK